ncbi:hypothetical protein [Kitasatospora viridis]|uniref:Uncharacterized protein n=1 Tax=Kitasatospora viridis TaxID=281105 RepID=A0A561UKP8_9ACTN|nr:hypothetical protein [Kitasatospora viridis]TWF99929.1 hypothetical protein FHX73_113789 [Kitasatospora viridis]
MYRAGDVADVSLELPGLPGWTVPATALVLADIPGEQLLLFVARDPAAGPGMHATGPVNTWASGLAVERPVTTGPAVARILLGRITEHHPIPGDMIERAHTQLATHLAARASTPLDVEHLGLLDVAMAAVADHRRAVTEAEQHRDRIVRRLRAGGVRPADIVRPGLSSSRIGQIAPSGEKISA